MVSVLAESPSPPPSISTPIESPCKAAITSLDKFKLDTPVKMKPLKEKEVLEVEDKRENDLEALRKRFVGDINLPESEEPLLKESKRRFVLFPIQYNEVSLRPFHSFATN
jgi:ribonucleoside-diphosphate reductase subunit M2